MNFEASSNMGKSIVPLQFSDPESSIKLTETKSIIDRFFFDLCGLQTIKSGDKDVLVRIRSLFLLMSLLKILVRGCILRLIVLRLGRLLRIGV